MGRLTLMSRKGDVGEMWEVGNDGSIQKAKARFDELVGKGALAFETVAPGQAEQITSFKPEAEEIVLVPAIRGGV